MDNQNAPKSGQVNYSSNNVQVFILIKKKKKLPLSPELWRWARVPCAGAGLGLDMNQKAAGRNLPFV